jgi:uncharacterized protein (DUF58 family)
MTVSLSLILLTAVILAVMIKARMVRFGHALIAALFGFFLASTGVAPGHPHLHLPDRPDAQRHPLTVSQADHAAPLLGAVWGPESPTRKGAQS